MTKFVQQMKKASPKKHTDRPRPKDQRPSGPFWYRPSACEQV